MVQVCDGRTGLGERRSSSVRGWFAVSSRQHLFVEHEKKTFFSWLAEIRSEDGSQGRCSCAFIEAKRRPLTVAAAKGTRAKRVLKPFSLGPLFSICLRGGAPERFLRFQMDTCVNGACAKLLISRMLTSVDIWSALGRSTVTQLGMTCHNSSGAKRRTL
jgi:hypothetical protein